MAPELRIPLTALAAAIAFAFLPPSASSAAASCRAFTASVYDQVSPASQAQSLRIRPDEAVVDQAGGFTTARSSTWSAAPRSGTSLVAVRRLYRPSSKNIFYSGDAAEIRRAVTSMGYVDQGVAFYAATSPSGCLLPVWSYYRSGKHRFVTSAAEQKQLSEQGWKRERIRFYLGKPKSVISFAVYPDTQLEVTRADDTRFVGRSNWLVSTAPTLATRYAMHTGDVVNWDTPDHAQFVRARSAMAPLTGRLLYSMAAGNHDTAAVGPGGSAADPTRTRTLVRDTRTFNTYLRPGISRTAEFEPGRAENSYSLFAAGGLNWMVLTLELWPRREAVAWARKVVVAHPKHNVIVVTHSYLSSDATRSTSNGGYGATSPQYLYDNLIKLYPNIKMTFSGHTGTAAYRRDVGVRGNAIHNYLLGMHSKTTNPIRMVEVNVSAGLVSSFVYAPATKTSYPAYYRPPASVSWVR
jgi:hypothetical protein